MISLHKKEPFILLLGDIIALYLGLGLMLLLRYAKFLNRELWELHATSFSILFVVWIGVFFIAGLYEKHTLFLKSRIGGIILNAQIANSLIAVLFFYFIPYFGIAPKTNLFIDLAISFSLILVWRMVVFPSFGSRNRERAILIGVGDEMRELKNEVNNNSRYNLTFTSTVDLDALQSFDFKGEILDRMYVDGVSIIAADFRNEKIEPILQPLYNLLFSRVRFIDMHRLYEDIFDRIPLSLVKYSWFLEHISNATKKGYDFLKRLMDILLAFILGVLSLTLYPFVMLAIKLEDGGPIFFSQDRLGKGNELIKIVKFRSLEVHHNANGVATEPKVTGVGKIIRKIRIDELPQLWNVLKGDLSLIGPRPEIPVLAAQYEKEIPYYNVRHLIKPGLSGWAQLYQTNAPRWGTGVDQTRIKLSYDLYYIKNRSLMLDLKIGLRTIKTLLSREGV